MNNRVKLIFTTIGILTLASILFIYLFPHFKYSSSPCLPGACVVPAYLFVNHLTYILAFGVLLLNKDAVVNSKIGVLVLCVTFVVIFLTNSFLRYNAGLGFGLMFYIGSALITPLVLYRIKQQLIKR